MKHVILDDLKPEMDGTPIFADLEFATPWSRFAFTVLPASGTFTARGEDIPCEQGYLVLGGPAELRAGSPASPPVFTARHDGAQGVFLGPVGCDHEVTNLGERSVRLVHVRVDLEQIPADSCTIAGEIDLDLLQWRDSIHGGTGRIATRHIWGSDQFASSWTFMDHAVLGPESSLGYHYHDALEECFLILAGSGYMTIADRTFVVAPGSVTFQEIQEGHGIYNPGPENLEFLRIAVAQPGEEYTTIDLHDDLSGRRPAEGG
ncbi:MAG: cupin domain-containing protein [Gemmatimonadetes bacterium]|jgi:mannose-6-phosphate isomerase-like protein (cupin superfamily)|nr:cupin domain-containing protein [Gemmatimonadota bacterium]